jgi:catechol 2,3-dioxygenase-like lactoylglutathione lyase family enzyme
MIKSFLHIGISVIDLDESVKFYSEIMQMNIEYRTRNKGEIISRIVGVKDADMDVCALEKNNLRIELLDYKNDEKKKLMNYPSQDQPGLVHISFLVDNVDKEYERIRAHGYEFNSPPMVARENGPKIAYFKGPDNVVIEIFEKDSSINGHGNEN